MKCNFQSENEFTIGMNVVVIEVVYLLGATYRGSGL